MTVTWADLSTPTDAEVASYFETTKALWKRPARTTFVHVVARSEERAAALLPEVNPATRTLRFCW